MKIKPLLYSVFIFLFILSGCNQSIENRINYPKGDKIKTKGYIEEFDRSDPYNIPEQVDRSFNIHDTEYNTKRANNIAKIITNFKEVEDTTVIIIGNTALIGVNLTPDVKEEDVDEIKKSIEEKTFLTDASLKNVSITTSPEMVERITDISKNLSSGKPVDGLAEELGSIIRRITPTI